MEPEALGAVSFQQRIELANFTGSQGTGGTMLVPGQFITYATPEEYINGNIFTRITSQSRTIDPRFNTAFQFQSPREARVAVGIEW